jgi:hypothetical protein
MSGWRLHGGVLYVEWHGEGCVLCEDAFWRCARRGKGRYRPRRRRQYIGYLGGPAAAADRQAGERAGCRREMGVLLGAVESQL